MKKLIITVVMLSILTMPVSAACLNGTIQISTNRNSRMTGTCPHVSALKRIYFARTLEAKRTASSRIAAIDKTDNDNDCYLTGDQANDIVAVAIAQDGKFASDFGFTTEWCTRFVSWCGMIAAPDLFTRSYQYGKHLVVDMCNRDLAKLYYFSKEARTSLEIGNVGVPDFDTGNYIQASINQFIPQKGDLILFNLDSYFVWSHIGIVTDVIDSMVVYADGNGSPAVEGTDPENEWSGRYVIIDHQIRFNDPTVIGYLRPYYT